MDIVSGESADEKISEREGQLETLREKIPAIEKNLAEAERRANELQGKLIDANEKLSELKDFVRGRELFQKYQRVAPRQLLQGVFTCETFTSFICGGAQTTSLETIWDVLRDCLNHGRERDAEILREVFEYCLEPVNASRTQASYSLLSVAVGKRFDSDFHSESPGNRAQGKISAVHLRGFRNEYNGRIIRKSVVQVS